jgi:hypothetical protein
MKKISVCRVKIWKPSLEKEAETALELGAILQVMISIFRKIEMETKLP